MCSDIVAVVVALLSGPFRNNADVAKQGLRAIGNFATENEEYSRLLGTMGACEGEWWLVVAVVFDCMYVRIYVHMFLCMSVRNSILKAVDV